MGGRRPGDRLRERLRSSDRLAAALFCAWAAAPVAALLGAARARGEVWGGAWAALGPADQYRYLAWIRDSGEHVLISNQFGLASGEHVYLHPMFLLSGLAWRLGASLQLAYLLWLPASVGVLVYGYRRYVAAALDDGWPRRVALVLALFFFTPLLAAFDYGQVFDRDMVNHAVIVAGAGASYWQAWGYLPTLMALGLMPLYLLWVEALVDPARRPLGRTGRWYAAWAGAAGLAVAWLHPWGGLILLLLIAAQAAPEPSLRRRRALLLPVLAPVLPLAYYGALDRAVPGWGLAQLQLSYDANRPLWAILFAFGPLLALAAAAGTRAVGARQSPFQARALWLWPAAALAVYFLVSAQAQLPALEGVTLPLAILAVRGWRRLAWGGRAAAALTILTVLAGMGYSAHTFYDYLRGEAVPYLLQRDDLAAMRHTAGPESGTVLASAYTGTAVPAFSGRPTWVAFGGLDPAFRQRGRRAEALLAGRLSRTAARRLLAASGVRWVLADCGHRADLEPALAPARVKRFGCATLYSVAGRR